MSRKRKSTGFVSPDYAVALGLVATLANSKYSIPSNPVELAREILATVQAFDETRALGLSRQTKAMEDLNLEVDEIRAREKTTDQQLAFAKSKIDGARASLIQSLDDNCETWTPGNVRELLRNVIANLDKEQVEVWSGSQLL